MGLWGDTILELRGLLFMGVLEGLSLAPFEPIDSVPEKFLYIIRWLCCLLLLAITRCAGPVS